jgi:hypothetical protein
MKEYFQLQQTSSPQYYMFKNMSPKLLMIFFDICKVCDEKGLKIVVTSMIRPKTIDSGIHELGRAIDFILDDNSDENIQWLVDYVNQKYQYDPGRPLLNTLIWHSANGEKAFASPHFHLQSM